MINSFPGEPPAALCRGGSEQGRWRPKQPTTYNGAVRKAANAYKYLASLFNKWFEQFIDYKGQWLSVQWTDHFSNTLNETPTSTW